MALATAFAAPAVRSETVLKDVSMVPGKSVRLVVGNKHSVSYFERAGNSCALTIVLADANEESQVVDANRTRFSVPVAAGAKLRIDGTWRMSAEFICSADATSMVAHVFQA